MLAKIMCEVQTVIDRNQEILALPEQADGEHQKNRESQELNQRFLDNILRAIVGHKNQQELLILAYHLRMKDGKSSNKINTEKILLNAKYRGIHIPNIISSIIESNQWLEIGTAQLDGLSGKMIVKERYFKLYNGTDFQNELRYDPTKTSQKPFIAKCEFNPNRFEHEARESLT